MLNSLRSRWAQSLQALSSRHPRAGLEGGSGLPTHSVLASSLPPPAPRSYAAGPAGQITLCDVLPAARAAFERCLDGLQGEGLDTQRRAIRHACSLRDLWHLRTGLYNEIARQFSQREAEVRLATLHTHFE
jgi:hypothetical protein